MPELLIDERIKSAVKEVSSRMHVILIDGKFVGITKRIRKNRGVRHGVIREYLCRGIIEERKFNVTELESVRQVPNIDLVSIKSDLSASKM